MKKIEGNVEAYIKRLRMLREIVCGSSDISQQEFADRLGIDMKRWNNYERGYPVPREIAFMLHKEFPGVSIEWIWFGNPNNLSDQYRKKVEAIEAADRDLRQATRVANKARAREKVASDKRKAVAR